MKKTLLLRVLLAGMLSAGPAYLAHGQTYHDHVVIVLDASGSMSGPLKGTRLSKMEAAKEALKSVLTSIPPTTYVGLLVFSSKNVQEDWIYELGPRNDEDLRRAIDLPQPHGSTPLGKYLKIGADRLLEERTQQYGYGTYRLLVVTDGEANDRALVERYTPDIISRGITVDVIGVAMNQDHTLATKVHSYRRANDPEALSQALQEVFAEVGSSGGDLAGEDAFALIAPLPSEVASGALLALSTSGNHPIGHQPAASQPEEEEASSSAPTVASAPPSAPTPTPPSPAPSPESGRKFPLWVALLVVLAIVIKVFKRR